MANSAKKKNTRVPLGITSLLLIVFFWKEILTIAFWGVLILGTIYLFMKNSRRIVGGFCSFQKGERRKIANYNDK